MTATKTKTIALPHYALAANRVPAGVDTIAHPEETAQVRHARIDPSVELRASIGGRPSTVTLTPDPQKPGVVRINGGPRNWEETEEGYNPPSVHTDVLANAIPNERQGGTVTFGVEVYGYRRFVATAVQVPGGFLRASKTLISITLGYDTEGVLSYQTDAKRDWQNNAIFVDPADLQVALNRVEAVVEAAEIIDLEQPAPWI